jgi:hypothetical protein
MMTATKSFSKAMHVRRSDTGCYEFASTRAKSFADATNGCMEHQYGWTVVEPLFGWGDWTHVVRVSYGPEAVYYFAR